MNSKYNLLSTEPPKMPKVLPDFVKHAISRVPEYMRPAAANGMFAPAALQLNNVTFRYLDNVLREPAVMEGCVSASGVGKGYLEGLYESMIRYQREHDKVARQKLLDYARTCKRKGQNQSKPERPTDAAIFVPEPDMTYPALIQLCMDAEESGNNSIYTSLPEIDLLNQCCGSHKKVTMVIRVNFDTKRIGAQRATIDGVTGNPFIRWKFNFSCVESKARKFFKDCIDDGTLGRIGISYIRKPVRRKGFPKQGNYDKEYLDKLDIYLGRLRSAKGEIVVPKINRLMLRLNDEMQQIADLADDDTFESLYHRSLIFAWIKGCILYISDGFRFTKADADFVEWTLYNDLWSKITLFTNLIKDNRSDNVEVDICKYGPANMLDQLPNTFSKEQLEQLRKSLGKPTYSTSQLTLWQSRNYIYLDEKSGMYCKTDYYLKRHNF